MDQRDSLRKIQEMLTFLVPLLFFCRFDDSLNPLGVPAVFSFSFLYALRNPELSGLCPESIMRRGQHYLWLYQGRFNGKKESNPDALQGEGSKAGVDQTGS
jgi:hypothetical protein